MRGINTETTVWAGAYAAMGVGGMALAILLAWVGHAGSGAPAVAAFGVAGVTALVGTWAGLAGVAMTGWRDRATA